MSDQEFVNKDYHYAVIGASNDSSKYGFKVLRDLLDSGFKATPINPNATEILGQKVYPTLGQLPNLPDVVIFVVPPKVSMEVVKEVLSLGIKKVWLQPGSESQEVIDFCSEHGIACRHDACIMLSH